MAKSVKFKQAVLFAGDILILYLSLFLMLFIRYGDIDGAVITLHLWPFSVVFILWSLVFYIAGFYEIRELKNTTDFAKKFSWALLINFLLAIMLFYFIPAFGITPKTNLFIFLLIFGSAAYGWRTSYNNLITAKAPAKKILLIGYNQLCQELTDHIAANPQLGYEITIWMQEGLQIKEFHDLSQIINASQINLIVVPAHIKKNSRSAKLIYKNLALGIEVLDLAKIYEILFQKIPLAELEEVWFLENIARNNKVHDAIIRPIEVCITMILAVITMPLSLLIMAIIKITSAGSAFFTQIRVGKNGRHFTLWKFRTMGADAEKSGPKWATVNDRRVTPFGKFLRRTHLDELPQLFNIATGELSLIGPRPERPEFTATLEKEIPYYALRHLIKPGLTGWAQINYRYGASLDDAYEKLQYDIYYLKNRSFWLDILILIKTIKRFFVPA